MVVKVVVVVLVVVYDMVTSLAAVGNFSEDRSRSVFLQEITPRERKDPLTLL